MTGTPETQPDWKEALGDRIWSRWRLWVVIVVVVFALNNLAGLLAGGLGLIAFAHRITGRALMARRLVEQTRRVLSDSDEVQD